MHLSFRLIQSADMVFRDAMLKKWGAPDRIQCVTCLNFFIPDFIDIGHVMRRSSSYAVRWREDNVLPQCRHCNRNLGGNKIEEKISAELYDTIWDIAHDPKYRVYENDIREIIKKYSL